MWVLNKSWASLFCFSLLRLLARDTNAITCVGCAHTRVKYIYPKQGCIGGGRVLGYNIIAIIILFFYSQISSSFSQPNTTYTLELFSTQKKKQLVCSIKLLGSTVTQRLITTAAEPWVIHFVFIIIYVTQVQNLRQRCHYAIIPGSCAYTLYYYFKSFSKAKGHPQSGGISLSLGKYSITQVRTVIWFFDCICPSIH